MRIGQKVARTLLVAMMVWSLPEISWAKSINHVSKVMTIGENIRLGVDIPLESVPKLVIELKDGLAKGDMFYINLEGAEWLVDTLQVENQPMIEAKKISQVQFEIRVKEDIQGEGSLFLPILAKVTGEEARVVVESNNTTLTAETLTFAHTSKEKGKVIVAAPSKVRHEGEMAKITLEEAYGGQFTRLLSQGNPEKIRLSLENENVEWDLTVEKTTPQIVGIKAYEGIKKGVEGFKMISPGILEVTLPEEVKQVNTSQKGAFVIEGVGIKSKEKEAKKQSVMVAIEGEWMDKTIVNVLDIADFNVAIVPKEAYKSLSGKIKEVSFTLEEDLPGSIQKNRSLDVTFTEGITLPLNKKGNVEVNIHDKPYEFAPIEEEGKCIGFEINGLEMLEQINSLSYTFKLGLEMRAPVKGESKIIVEGRGLPKTLEVPIIEVKPVITTQIEAFQVVEGKKDQVGGNITLAETQANALEAGKKLFIQMDLENMTLVKAPLVRIESGDIVVGEPEVVEGGVTLEILKASTKPSTISLKHFMLDISGVVADGRYQVAIGGPALSQLSSASMISQEARDIDDLIEADFILVNTLPKDLKKITFKLGEEAYAVNGIYHHLDVPAYIEGGRTLVPIKYVAEALGIPVNKVKWNKETEEITLYGRKVIELEIGSNIMWVDGKKTYMQTEVILSKGRTMVPIGEIARALEVDTTWDNKTQTATFVSYQ